MWARTGSLGRGMKRRETPCPKIVPAGNHGDVYAFGAYSTLPTFRKDPAIKVFASTYDSRHDRHKALAAAIFSFHVDILLSAIIATTRAFYYPRISLRSIRATLFPVFRFAPYRLRWLFNIMNCNTTAGFSKNIFYYFLYPFFYQGYSAQNKIYFSHTDRHTVKKKVTDSV